MTQAKMIKELRKRAAAIGMTQLGERCGLNAKTLYKTLGPEGNPRISSFLAICQALNVPVLLGARAKAARKRRVRSAG